MLKSSAKPVSYDIDITVNDDMDAFDGRTKIRIENYSEESKIFLNFGDNLTIKNVYCNEEELPLITLDNKIAIDLPKETKETEICVDYEGKMCSDQKGIFHKENIVFTQCEPENAHCVFPCIDDPQFRATFKTRIKCNKRFIALSNAQAESIETNEEYKTTTFKETIPLPTYLFALAVGEFYHIHTETKRSFPIEVYAIEEMKDFADFVVDLIPRIVDWMEEKTGIALPGDQLQVMITNDHTGMENFGLVIYGPNSSLRNMQKARESTINDSLEVFVHEISHLWMGGVTTFKSWNDLWIKEGFASFMAPLILDELRPDIGKAKQYISREYYNVLRRSTKGNERAIIDDCIKCTSDLYDSVSYAKASCLYRMLIMRIGMDKFLSIITSFLKENYLAASSYDDFVAVFSKEMKYDMKPFFDSWTKNRGIPFVIVEDRKVSQFSLSKENKLEEGKWIIPLIIKYFEDDTSKETKFILDKNEMNLNIDAAWKMINKDSAALCVTVYKGNELNNICEAAKSMQLSDIEAGSLVVNARICYEKNLICSNDVAKIINAISNYESKLVTLPAVDLLFALCEKDDFDSNLILPFFEKQNVQIRANASPGKLFIIVKALLTATTQENVINILRQNKCGKNVIKQIRVLLNK